MLGIAVAVSIIVALTGLTLVGNDFRFHQERLSIPAANTKLDAVLTTPTGSSTRGLVVVIHGDGAVKATQNGLYLPWFEAAADAGYATLSWSKPGIGSSGGNWLDQNMADRAAEVSAVIDWAVSQESIPTDRIVLWGASQAGWVFPKVAASRDDITAVVAVNPAINWIRQGLYNLLAELDHDNVDPDTRNEAIHRRDQRLRLLEQNVDYGTYRANTNDPEPWDEDRWQFVLKNYTSDATDDLAAMSSQHVPVFLMLSEHDRNVDVSETAATYQNILGSDVTVAYFDAVHAMARPVMDDSEILGLVTAVLWPRALMAENALDSYRDYLRTLP